MTGRDVAGDTPIGLHLSADSSRERALEGGGQRQVFWQIEPTSRTQVESHLLLQQYESEAQIWATQGSHDDGSFVPVEQVEWEQLLVLPLVELLELELPPVPPDGVPTPTACHAAVTEAISSAEKPSCCAACSQAVFAPA